MTPFGERVRRLRRERGLLLKDMAAHLGVSSAYLSALERGERGKPTWTLIQGVIHYFNIIWDEADELARLADLSDPRVKIDTAGTTPRETLLANRLAREIAGADRRRGRGAPGDPRRRARPGRRRPGDPAGGLPPPSEGAERRRLTLLDRLCGGCESAAPSPPRSGSAHAPHSHRRADPRQRHRRRACADRRSLSHRAEGPQGSHAAHRRTPGRRALSAPWGRRSIVSGGSGANTAAGVASSASRRLHRQGQGRRDRPSLRARPQGHRRPLRRGAAAKDGPATARSFILVTPDGERTMNTYLGACQNLTPDDVSPETVRAASIVYLEGYLWDPPAAKEAFRKAVEDRPRGRQPGRAHLVRRLLRRPLPRRVPGPDARRQPRHPVRQYPRAAEPLRHVRSEARSPPCARRTVLWASSPAPRTARSSSRAARRTPCRPSRSSRSSIPREPATSSRPASWPA